jgi:ubiquinone/menaquinone biosynthesis C-methylase UbiE
MTGALRGAIPSPNIWEHEEVYEIENRAVDPEHAIEAAMRSVRDWSGAVVLDIGCGSGFHLPGFAETAARVIGIEPHARLCRHAERRIAGLTNVEVRQGIASALPVADASVDVAHARWAYFFGPGCEPGLAELDRVMRRGGAAFVIDNDSTTSTFGRWFRSGYPAVAARPVETFFSARGWNRQPVRIRWLFESRADFETVVRIEFPPDAASRILADHEGVEVDYAVNVWSKTF